MLHGGFNPILFFLVLSTLLPQPTSNPEAGNTKSVSMEFLLQPGHLNRNALVDWIHEATIMRLPGHFL